MVYRFHVRCLNPIDAYEQFRFVVHPFLPHLPRIGFQVASIPIRFRSRGPDRDWSARSIGEARALGRSRAP